MAELASKVPIGKGGNSSSASGNLGELINNAPILRKCQPTERLRLLPGSQVLNIEPGQDLVQAGGATDYLYLIVSGSVSVSAEGRTTVLGSGNYVGEEAALGLETYGVSAEARTDCTVLAVAQGPLRKLLAQYPKEENAFYTSLLAHYTGQAAPSKPVGAQRREGSKQKAIGWGMALLVPATVLILGRRYGLDWGTLHFLTVFSAVIVMWVFRTMAEFIPSMLAIVAFLVLGLAPVRVVLSGFTSGSFFMAMSVFGLGAVLMRSGITYRIVLHILRRVPTSLFSHNLALLLLGTVITPIIPSANGRIALMSPMLADMVDTLGYRPGQKAASSLAASAFAGFTLMSTVFLSSKSVNFLVFGLLPSQVAARFSWGYWALAALVCGVVMLVLYTGVSTLLFKTEERPSFSRNQVGDQLRALGPLRFEEWVAVIGVALFVIGVLTASIHKVSTPWIGMGVLLILLALGVLSKERFRADIDWSFLLYLGGLIGLVQTMSYLGLDQQLAGNLSWLGRYMQSNLGLFILFLAGLIFLVRLLVPNNATVAIFCTIMLPMAEANGINPWVVGFIILTLSDGWVLPYQCTYYLQFLGLARERELFNEAEVLRINVIVNVLRLAGIYASLPYWRMLGIM